MTFRYYYRYLLITVYYNRSNQLNNGISYDYSDMLVLAC
jgi:hypothetical protein